MSPNYVGIDVGADTFVCSIFSAPDAVPQTSGEFSNTPEGFIALEEWLNDRQVSPDDSIVCLEATGVYGEMLCYWLAAKGYRLAVEPPLKVKRAFKVKGHKNDRVDSRQIAEYAYRYKDQLNFWQPRSELVEQVAGLLATRE